LKSSSDRLTQGISAQGDLCKSLFGKKGVDGTQRVVTVAAGTLHYHLRQHHHNLPYLLKL